MEPLAYTVIASHQTHSGSLAHSARPDAPVVAATEPVAHFVRSRDLLAAALHRLADVTAPPARVGQACGI